MIFNALGNLFAPFLAQQDHSNPAHRLREAFRNYRANPEESPFASLQSLLVVMGIVLLVLFAATRIIRQKSRPVAARNPRRLFSTLLQQLGATYTDRLLMHQAAHHAQLAQPAMMLLSPELFQRYAINWADQLRIGFFRQRVHARFEAIAARAFAPTN